MKAKGIEKPKGKRKGKGCLIAGLVIVVLLIAVGGIGWLMVSAEHREARNLPLNAINFSRLTDGIYPGEYEGGMYKWRSNQCEVTVNGGIVTEIDLVKSIDPANERTNAEMLYDRVIKDQSLQVDTISGSTLTSKGYLQCIENALLSAQQ